MLEGFTLWSEIQTQLPCRHVLGGDLERRWRPAVSSSGTCCGPPTVGVPFPPASWTRRLRGGHRDFACHFSPLCDCWCVKYLSFCPVVHNKTINILRDTFFLPLPYWDCKDSEVSWKDVTFGQSFNQGGAFNQVTCAGVWVGREASLSFRGFSVLFERGLFTQFLFCLILS